MYSMNVILLLNTKGDTKGYQYCNESKERSVHNMQNHHKSSMNVVHVYEQCAILQVF